MFVAGIAGEGHPDAVLVVSGIGSFLLEFFFLWLRFRTLSFLSTTFGPAINLLMTLFVAIKAFYVSVSPFSSFALIVTAVTCTSIERGGTTLLFLIARTSGSSVMLINNCLY